MAEIDQHFISMPKCSSPSLISMRRLTSIYTYLVADAEKHRQLRFNNRCKSSTLLGRIKGLVLTYLVNRHRYTSIRVHWHHLGLRPVRRRRDRQESESRSPYVRGNARASMVVSGSTWKGAMIQNSGNVSLLLTQTPCVRNMRAQALQCPTRTRAYVSYLTSVRSTLLPRILQPGVKLCR